MNVLCRAHYLPVFARLGPYERGALDRFTAASGEVFEYWGHAASLLPAAHHRLFRWRMAGRHPWPSIQAVLDDHPGYVEAVLDEVAARGPLRAADLEAPGGRAGPWWGYGKGKLALEWLFMKGRITAYRTSGFRRLYDLPERVLPRGHLEEPDASAPEAHRELVLLAARHHGVGTAADLADYYRLKQAQALAALRELEAEGKLERVEIEGSAEPAWLHPATRRPRKIRGTRLLCPFDSVVWNRARAERLFAFRYRIEIYTPEAKRVHGYYVLPVLHDGALAGRVDLKAHRKERWLEVRAAWVEGGAGAAGLARGLAPELWSLAAWLHLDEVRVAPKGTLAGELAEALGAT